MNLKNPNPLREVPDRIWWCFGCNAGVGVWGLDRGLPPPRCPGCHANDFAPVKFVHEKKDSRKACDRCGPDDIGRCNRCDEDVCKHTWGSCRRSSCDLCEECCEARGHQDAPP